MWYVHMSLTSIPRHLKVSYKHWIKKLAMWLIHQTGYQERWQQQFEIKITTTSIFEI